MKIQITIIICVALLSAGLAFVRISQNTHQSNDQSQNTVVNTITKTVVVNVGRGKKYENIKWEQKYFETYKESFVHFNNELNEWQKQSSKYFVNDGLYYIFYPTVNTKPIVYTNKRTVTNKSKHYSTNINEISNPILRKIKSWF